MMLTVGGGLIGFLAMIHLAGFYGAILVFMFYYLRFLGRHSLTQSIAIAVATPVVGFFFFDVAMRIIPSQGVSGTTLHPALRDFPVTVW